MSMATILKSCSLDSDASARGFVPEEIDLGDDVLAEIILRLPLDSVARSRCVSKNWCAAIADGYLRRRLRLHMSMICFPDNDDALGGGGGGSRPVYACAGEGRRLEVRDLGFFPLHDSVIFCDGCNGLLLCRTPGAPEFYVVSPLTRSWAALPRPAKEARLSVLAFDPLGGSPQHYHVINFTGWRDRGAAVEVFSSETRAWAARDVDFGGVPAGSLSGSVHCHGGAVYFLACDPDCIVRMDLAAGAGLACTVIDLPEARAGGRRRPRRALRRPAALLLQPRRAAQSLVARGRPPAPAVAPEARSESRRRRGGRRRRGEVPGDAPGESGGGLHMVAVEGRRVRPGQARDHRRGVGVRQGREEPCRQRRGLSRPRATFQIALRTMVRYWRAELIRDGYVAVRSEPCLTHRTEME